MPSLDVMPILLPLPQAAAGGVQEQYYLLVRYKTSSPAFYWKILIVLYLAVLQIVGIVLALQTRRVKFPGLRDSKYVGAISNLVLVILAADIFLLNNYFYIYGITFPLGILILNTVYILLTFIPKVHMHCFGQYTCTASIMDHYTVDGPIVPKF